MTPLERFNALRTRLVNLGMDVADFPLQLMLRSVDDLWRDLIAVRHQMALDVGDTGCTGDFYVYVSMIYAGRAGDPKCNACGAWVAAHHRVCQFCSGRKFTVDEPERPSFVPHPHEAELAERRSYPSPKLAHGAGSAESVRPVTWKKIKHRVDDLQRYMRRAAFAAYFPFTPEQLTRRKLHDLRAIGKLCQGWADAGMGQASRQPLIMWILSAQPTHPVHPGPPPIGTLPDLSDLEESPLG